MFVRFQKCAGYFKVTLAQSLGKHKNSRVKSKYSLGTGETKFSLGRGNNPLGRVPLGVLQWGVTLYLHLHLLAVHFYIKTSKNLLQYVAKSREVQLGSTKKLIKKKHVFVVISVY